MAALGARPLPAPRIRGRRDPSITAARPPPPRQPLPRCRADNGGGHPALTTAAAAPPAVPPASPSPSPPSSSSSSSTSLDELAALVREQRRLIDAQQRELERLSAEVAAATRRLQQPPSTSPPPPPPPRPLWEPPSGLSPFEAQRPPAALVPDRRARGLFDARYHSTRHGSTPPSDYRALPPRIILVRHAESEGNVDHGVYTRTPDPLVPLTERGRDQARRAGLRLRALLERATLDEAAKRGGAAAAAAADPSNFRVFFLASPYRRALQTYEGLRSAFAPEQVRGFQEEVWMREQDFGADFQDREKQERQKEQRLRYGRFWFRFDGGEAGADVYDRMSLFVDRLTRDINAGRFAAGAAAAPASVGAPSSSPSSAASLLPQPPAETSLVLVSHGLALRVFLMRWFGWTVDELLRVFNPPNATPIVLERMDPRGATVRGGGGGGGGGGRERRLFGGGSGGEAPLGGGASAAPWIHTQALYRLSDESLDVLRGCTPSMAVNQIMLSESEESSDDDEDEDGRTSSSSWRAAASAAAAPAANADALGGSGGGSGGSGEEEDDSSGEDSDGAYDGSGAQGGSPRPPYNDFFYGP